MRMRATSSLQAFGRMRVTSPEYRIEFPMVLSRPEQEDPADTEHLGESIMTVNTGAGGTLDDTPAEAGQ